MKGEKIAETSAIVDIQAFASTPKLHSKQLRKLIYPNKNYFSMKKILFGLLFLFLTNYTFAQTGNITVFIKGIKNTKGNIELGLYNSKKDFTIYSKNYKGATLKPSVAGVEYTFKNIPKGTYAIAVWHDKNKNKKIDKNWFGVPTEYYGFSLNKYGTFGPPDFNDVSFKVIPNETKKLTIVLK